VLAFLVDHWKRESLQEVHITNTGTKKEGIKVGDMVIILAVVQELQHGDDNFVRSAST